MIISFATMWHSAGSGIGSGNSDLQSAHSDFGRHIFCPYFKVSELLYSCPMNTYHVIVLFVDSDNFPCILETARYTRHDRSGFLMSIGVFTAGPISLSPLISRDCDRNMLPF